MPIENQTWSTLCQENSGFQTAVPLFDTQANSSIVLTLEHGRNRRQILKRHPAMEQWLRQLKMQLIQDFQTGVHQYEGLLYLIFWKQENQIVPLYIGKAATQGKKPGKLSDTITMESEFLRWGYDHDSHLGDLSAWVCNHALKHRRDNYENWAKMLFESYPSERPQIRFPVWFWAGLYPESPASSPTQVSLVQQEKNWIAAATQFSSETLLNVQGRKLYSPT